MKRCPCGDVTAEECDAECGWEPWEGADTPYAMELSFHHLDNAREADMRERRAVRWLGRSMLLVAAFQSVVRQRLEEYAARLWESDQRGF